jgi:hypothetical protein
MTPPSTFLITVDKKWIMDKTPSTFSMTVDKKTGVEP